LAVLYGCDVGLRPVSWSADGDRVGVGSTVLVGRAGECARLDDLIGAVGRGESRALVIRGEAGVGKTALLEYVVERASASAFRVMRAVGVQSEMELAFAGLHQLTASMLDRLERLPAPQRDALCTAFGLSAGPAPDRFLVALAVLNLLAEVAEDRPLVCVVDDEQWLDRASAQALAFVGRRLDTESVGLVFAARVPSDELAGMPEVLVEGLREVDARALLNSVLTGPVDPRVRDRIVRETRGNPLALWELPREPAELAGGFGLPSAPSLSGRIEENFRRQIEALPAETRRLVLVAAADPVGEPLLVWRAADRLAIGFEAAAPATDAGLVEFGAHVRFRHPLVRAASYGSASVQERQAAHAALAEATDAEVDPDRRAWHRAHASAGPDEQVAAELERSAARAQARGGWSAAAAFHQRAAELTAEPGHRTQRTLAAARAMHIAGAPDAALGLLLLAEAGSLDELARARVELLRAQIAFVLRRGRDAPWLLLRAAKRLEPLDLELARLTYVDALSAGVFAGRVGGDLDLVDVATAALAAPRPRGAPGPTDLFLEGVATEFTDGYAAAAPILKQALGAFCSRPLARTEQARCRFLAFRAACLLWDDESLDVLTRDHVQRAREAGALTELPLALTGSIFGAVLAGDLLAASSLVDELTAVCSVIGMAPPPYGPTAIAAWRGREGAALRLIEPAKTEAGARGERLGLGVAEWGSAVLFNGLRRHKEALTDADRWLGDRENQGFSKLALPEAIEAAVRSGEPERALEPLEQLTQSTRISGTDWALGIEARSSALLSEGEEADRRYREAIERLARTPMRGELARAHLLYGEWLRRERRRVDARVQLRTAHGMLDAMGAEAFAERARRELLATGETVRKRVLDTRDDLTAQEAQIARLARDGLSNPEIGARLFITPRTVKYHLHKVFTKLDITSRTELGNVLPRESAAVGPT
jgi:DNA-binding CsgD family transcriptional regulator